MIHRQSGKAEAVPYLFLALIIGILYARTLVFPLLEWDDRQHICANPALHPLDLYVIWARPYFGLYAPLSYSLWSLPAAFAGADCVASGTPFHLLNLSLHILNSCLVFNLLRAIAPDPSSRKTSWAALLGALVFAVHPLQVESVAWISAERDLLCVALGLIGLRLFVADRRWSANVFLILSFLAKAVAVAFPALALAFLFFRNRGRQWWTLAPAFIAAVASAVVAKTLQADQLLRVVAPVWIRPFIYLHNIGFYLFKFVWPSDLVPDHARSISLLSGLTWSFWPAILGLIWLTLPTSKSCRKIMGPVVWILIALLPTSGLISFGFQETSTVADHYFYLAMAGFAWLTMILCFESSIWRRAVMAFLIAMGVVSFWQVDFWRSDEALFRHNTEVQPRSMIAHSNLGFALLRRQATGQAREEFKKALLLSSQSRMSWLGLARSFEFEGQTEQAEATYRRAISEHADNAEILNNLAALMYRQGRDQAEAKELWLEAARADANYLEPRYNLGQLAFAAGDLQQALIYFSQAELVAPLDVRVQERLQATRQRLRAHDSTP